MAERSLFFGAIAHHRDVLESVLARIAHTRETVPERLGVHGHAFAIRGSGARSSPSSGLRAWLAGIAAIGSSDTSTSATQTALAAYERWQTGCFQRLDGNFCLAVHEPALGRIRLAADVTGAKSLFFSVEPSMDRPEVVVFGSSAMEVLRAAALPAVASAAALQRYLRRGALAGSKETLLRRVHALRRGHYLEIVSGISLQVREAPFPQDEEIAPTVGTLEDAAQCLRDGLLQSVSTHARGAGNIAVAGSGGIDSSGILGCLGQVREIAPLHIYSYLQRPPAIPQQWDERPWAELAARRAGAQLHSVEVDTSEVPGLLASVVATQDFPFGSPVILAQAKLFRVAAENGVNTMLCGHGADLLFGGADIHLALRLAHLIRKGRLVAAAQMLPGARAHSAGGTMRLLASTAARVCGFGSPETWRTASVVWGSRDWFRERIAVEPAEARAIVGRLETMGELMERQLGDCLGATTLLYEDCNARSHGMETRLPYMVASLARLARAARPEYLVSERGESKYLLRRAVHGLVPEEILARRDRIGFAVPVLPWLIQQRAWVNDRYARLQTLPFFRGVSTRDLWGELERGGTASWRRAFHLWRWIVLLEWSETHNVRFE
jgi:asparagine synthase (glutamine-hydrolysing)